MRPCFISLRSLLLLLLAAGAALLPGCSEPAEEERQAAEPAEARPVEDVKNPSLGCPANIPPGTPCRIAQYTARFYSNAGGTIEISSTADTIYLDTGYVYIQPATGRCRPYCQVLGDSSATLSVKPKYTTVGAPSPGSPATQSTAGNVANAHFLVMSLGDSSVIALVMGSLTAPSTLTQGCQQTFTASGSANPIPIQPPVVTVLQQFGVTNPPVASSCS
ncbi:MAG TPA: hypothetical protein VFX98_00390 [Longimicrobiaceae bacterium]|nr:hypothetical protein [Longimicrobiaceae bacterium]